MDTKKVVWSEGMFLSPQHFQQQERYLENFTKSYMGLLIPDRYGIASLDLDISMLKIGKIRVRRASGIFPDGTPFILNKDIVIEIPENTSDKTVYLALPIYRSGIVDVRRDAAANIRNVAYSHDVFDSSLDNSESAQLEIADLNLSIKVQGEDLQDYTVLPILQVVERKTEGEGEVEVNKGFIPRCLYVKSSEYIHNNIKEIYALIKYRSEKIYQRIKGDTSTKSNEVLLQDYLWLQTLGRWQPIIQSWINNPVISPEDCYNHLIVMSNEMASLEPRLLDEFPPFSYDNLYKIYTQVFSLLRVSLRQVRQDAVTQLEWDESLFEKRRLLKTKVSDKGLYQSGRFILSVSSSIGVNKTAELFPVASKLSGFGKIAELVRNSLSGVALSHLPVPPNELKAKSEAAYFEVDLHSSLWQEIIQRDEAIVLHIDERLEDVEIEFFAIR